MIRRIFPIAMLFLIGAAAPSGAQSVGAQGYVTYGATAFAAADTFDAVAGSRADSGIGFGATVTGLWRGLFVDAGFAQQRVQGERVFMDSGTVYKLGIPLSIKMRPVDVAAGWRFLSSRRLSPFVGAGVSFISYTETADFAAGTDNVSDSGTGALLLGGVDVAIARWIKIGGEIRYRAVDGVLGESGVSAAFGEDQLGGFSTGLRLTVGR